MPTTVTSKGQVTIPKPVRDILGIVPGSRVEFTLDADGRVVVALADPGPRPVSKFALLRGAADADMTTDQIMALTRGEV